MANVATIVDVDVDVCMYLEARRLGKIGIRTFTTLYRMTGKKYLIENWRTG